MPTYETEPGQKTMVFVHPKNGEFELSSSEKPVKAIEGTLDLVRIEQDPGNTKHKIAPYDAFVMQVSDDESIYRIKINAERNFSTSVGKVLADLQKGDRVMLKAKPGDDPTVTFCNILKNVDGTWVRPEMETFPADKAAKVARLKEIVESHSAYSAPKSSE